METLPPWGPTHFHVAPSESPVEIFHHQLPPFGVFHELGTVLQEEGEEGVGRKHTASHRTGSRVKHCAVAPS